MEAFNVRIMLAGVMSMSFLSCTTDYNASVQPNQTQLEIRNGAQKSTSDVQLFSDASVVGLSNLIRTPNSVQFNLETSGLTDGDAITVWYVVFNNPEECGSTPCGEADIFNPATQTDVLYAAGHVVDDGDDVGFAGHLAEGDNAGSIMGFFNMLLGTNLPSTGLLDSYAAEVHFVVRTHQEAIPEFLPDMINTFNGGCIYPAGVSEDFGAEGPNVCSDMQFSIHTP